jgi:hypothetical protein
MDAESTIPNDLFDFLNANQPGVVNLERTAGKVAAIVDDED